MFLMSYFISLVSASHTGAVGEAQLRVMVVPPPAHSSTTPKAVQFYDGEQRPPKKAQIQGIQR